MMKTIGLFAAVILPFWNIPLIVRIGQRKSSKDVSLWWTFGVLGCLLFMLPSGLVSTDPVFKAFSIVNIVLFSGVAIQVLRYR